MQHRLIFLIALVAFGFSCARKGCTDPGAYNYDERARKDDGSCLYPPEPVVTLHFNHSFDTQGVAASDFEQFNYTNAAGAQMNITKLDYLISDVRFFKPDGDSILVDGYHFVRLSDAATLQYTLPQTLPGTTYNGMAFHIGFIQQDNVSGAYSDLNAASWNWPEMLGGGYHQLQLEGRFITTAGDTLSYAFHSGSTIRKITGTDTTFHANSIYINLPFAETLLDGDATVNLNMNVAEWLKNPFTWDFNTWSVNLMGNFDAQIEMRANGADVFTVEGIVE